MNQMMNYAFIVGYLIGLREVGLREVFVDCNDKKKLTIKWGGWLAVMVSYYNLTLKLTHCHLLSLTTNAWNRAIRIYSAFLGIFWGSIKIALINGVAF